MLPTKPIRSNTISKHFVHTVGFLSDEMISLYCLFLSLSVRVIFEGATSSHMSPEISGLRLFFIFVKLNYKRQAWRWGY
jgi:hypothetical protein